MNKFMEGKKTYAGIAIILLGWFGLDGLFKDAEVAQIVDLGVQLIGIVLAIYGRYKVGVKLEKEIKKNK